MSSLEWAIIKTEHFLSQSIDTANVQFVSCQMKLDEQIFLLITFCCNNETHRSILD